MQIKKSVRILFLFTCFFIYLHAGSIGCAGSGSGGDLRFPFLPAIDSVSDRLFVVDNRSNGLNLVDTLNDDVILFDGTSLLDDEDPQLLSLFPNLAVVAPLAGGNSRLFITGGGVAPTNQVVVLDFDGQNLSSANFSPISVAGSVTDTLSGLAVDADLQRLFVGNATTGLVHVYNLSNGVEVAESPIAIGGIPGRMNLDPELDLLVVSNSAGNSVSFIDLQNLAAPVETLDVGLTSRDVALADNGSGAVLFVSGLQQNTARVFRLNLANLAASSLIFQLNPPSPTDPIPDPNFLTGNLNLVKGGRLTDNRLAGFYTQSSGDLLVLDITSDLTNITPSIVTVGAISGEGIDLLLDNNGEVTKAYYASPGIGAVTVVDPLTNQFTDQIQ